MKAGIILTAIAVIAVGFYLFQDYGRDEAISNEVVETYSTEYLLNAYFFGDPYRLSPPEFDIKRYTDPERWDARFVLWGRMSKVMDYGEGEIAPFFAYGLSKSRGAKYEIDTTTYPEWNSLPSLLGFVWHQITQSNSTYELQLARVSPAGIEIISNYMRSTNPSRESGLASLDYVETEYVALKSSNLDRQGYRDAFIRTNKELSTLDHEIRKEWALGLVQQLQESDQISLVRYLLGNSNRMSILPTPIGGERINRFIEMIDTGSGIESLRNSLN